MSRLLLAVLIAAAGAQYRAAYVVDLFSARKDAAGLPEGWKPLVFKKIPRNTAYELREEGGNFFVQATADNAASGLLKQTNFPLKQFPILSWRWKVDHALKTSDATKKSGDDYAARVYVAFSYDPAKASLWEKTKYGTMKTLYGDYPPKAALNYVWDNKLPVGKALDNAYTSRVKMIVVESGDEKAGQWMKESRNVIDDYKNLFGGEPPEVAFIAIMTDTDQTHETARAFYDDLIFLSSPTK